MLFSDYMQDRYCRFTCNQDTGQFERNWIQYADGTFEPVRRDGNLSRKWSSKRTDFTWWTATKPADWMPWEHGHGFSWNHDFGETDKPADWGGKSPREIEAGDAPYFMAVDLDGNGRIESRTERINGRRETWQFQYDEDGRLTGVLANTGWAQDFEYDAKGRRSADYAVGREPFMRQFAYDENDRLLSVGDTRYEHDANGFRSARIDASDVTRYRYAEDYRLLGATLPDGREIEYEHDEDGQRSMKFINGEPVEAYDWLDFIRLAKFFDGDNEYVFHYDEDSRLPRAMQAGSNVFTLEYDQVGSLKAVVADTGHVVKMCQYDGFGNLLWDSNPALRIPLGFAGGLHDPDTGLTRFGWRDYDPDTARWTAPDPIGDAGGDDDWYGYCLDDPVNAVAPLGLWGFVLPFMAGTGAATGIAGIGSALAGLATDGLGALAGENTDAPFKATEGAMKGMAGAAAVNTGIAAGAAGAAGAAKVAPAVAAAAPSLIRQGKDAVKTVESKAKDAAKAGVDWTKSNPDKVDKAGKIAADLVDPNLPPQTPEGQFVSIGRYLGNRLTQLPRKESTAEYEKKNRQTPPDWWGR